MSLEAHRREAPTSLGCAVLTVSDTRTPGDDPGGSYLVERLEAAGHRVLRRALVRDEALEIESALREVVALEELELVLVTGGTGIAPRDVTYPTLKRLLDEELPGFGELFRMLSFREIGPAAMLSRALGGLYHRRVVLALPGSPKALRLALDELVLPEAGHLVAQARGARRR